MLITALIGGLLVGATACSSGPDEELRAVPAEAPGNATPAASSGVPGNDEIPADRRAAFVEALREIDPGLVTNEERAVRRARSTCLDIAEGGKGAALADRVAQRYTGGNATIDAEQAQQVIAAAKRWICG